MYNDCKDGKIDLILTKSISRFARNTYDCIDTVRKLKVFGVGVKFEKENIDTMRLTSEVELAALSSIAQEESMSLSKNVRIGIQYRMKNGTFKQGCLPYGFTLKDGVWTIVEEQAKIVRMIFNAYINGSSLRKISEQLRDAKVIKNDGTYNWNDRRIAYIIRNVRYKGDALLQKTYTEDFPFKSRDNHGERDMYYIKNSNVPIVSEEIFDKANKRLADQSKRFRPNTEPRGYLLSKRIYCKECGTMYRRKSGEVKVYWVCRKKDHDASVCPAPQIAEQELYSGFVHIYNRLVNNIENILAPIVTQLTELRNQKLRTAGAIENINKEIAAISEQLLMYTEMKSQGYMEAALFMEKSTEAKNKIIELKKEKKILTGNDACKKTIQKTEAIINVLKMTGPLGEFDKRTFKKIIERIWVDKEKNITYELVNGLKLTIEHQEVI